MTHPTPARGTSTTLRLPRQALFVGRSGSEVEDLLNHLRRDGYFVTAVARGDEALRKMRTVRFQVVLADVGLPDMDGPQLVGAIRSEPPIANVPVIVMAGPDAADVVERCLAKGADDYLPPQFGAEMLRGRISAALNRQGLKDADNLRRDMDVARSIQRDFLPESLPQVAGVALQAVLIPAREVSGDFYDAFPQTPSGKLFLVIGDVCDKGVGAALFMALFRSLIRASADPMAGGAVVNGRRSGMDDSVEPPSAGELLTQVAAFTNNYIAVLHGRTNMFATVFLAVLDPASGELDYVNAGHEPALIVGRGGAIQELRPTGPALGMMPDVEYRADAARLGGGETFLAFTDGVIEARSSSGEIYGSGRLRDAVGSHGGLAAPDLVRELVDALGGFARYAEPHDDITMLAATRT